MGADSLSTTIPTVEMSDVAIGYGRIVVAQGLNARWRGGELRALMGSNGAGKSTLARTILGLQRPLGGVLKIFGAERSHCEYLSQGGRLGDAAPLSVREAIRLGRRARVSAEEVAVALKSVDLAGFEGARLNRLSGGERQRVLLARVLVSQARVIVVDEPTTGVDARASILIWKHLKKLSESESRLVIVVTHDSFLAPKFADHIDVLHASGLRELGDSQAPMAETANA